MFTGMFHTLAYLHDNYTYVGSWSGHSERAFCVCPGNRTVFKIEPDIDSREGNKSLMIFPKFSRPN